MGFKLLFMNYDACIVVCSEKAQYQSQLFDALGNEIGQSVTSKCTAE